MTTRPQLLAFDERQPRENLYRRFFSPKPPPSEKQLAHFTHVDFRDSVALFVEHRGDFIAWASYQRWPGRADACQSPTSLRVDDVVRAE